MEHQEAGRNQKLYYKNKLHSPPFYSIKQFAGMQKMMLATNNSLKLLTFFFLKSWL